MTSPEMIILVSALTTSAVTIINTVKAKQNNEDAKVSRNNIQEKLATTDTKLDTIHQISNGRLNAALTRIGQLEALVQRLIDAPPHLLEEEKELALKSVRSGSRLDSLLEKK
jgi:hypothetical protein